MIAMRMRDKKSLDVNGMKTDAEQLLHNCRSGIDQHTEVGRFDQQRGITSPLCSESMASPKKDDFVHCLQL